MANLAAGRYLAGPIVIASVVLILLPLLATLMLSLFQYDALSTPQFVGLAHFQRLFSDELFIRGLQNSLWIALLSWPLRLGLALLLGLLLSSSQRLSRIGLMVVLLPVLLPEIAWSMAWLWLLNPHFGPAAWALDAWQPRGSDWLLTAQGARSSIVAVISLLIGEMVLIVAVARERLNPQMFAMCALEGGSRWYAFRRISWPLLLPLIVLLGARDVAVSLQLSFIPSLYVTKTGPQFATYLLPNAVYQNAFEYLHFGYAAAMSSVLIILLLLLAFVQALWLRHGLAQNQ